MTSNTSQWQATTCSSCGLTTNPNLNKEKYLQTWLANVDPDSQRLQVFDDSVSSSWHWQTGDIAVAKPPHSGPLQSTNCYSLTPAACPPPYPGPESQSAGSSSASQTFWSCRCLSSKSDPPPQLPLVHSPDTIVSPYTPAELLLVQHTHSHNNACHREDASPFSELEFESSAPQDSFYFVPDPYNPSRICLPQSSFPLSELQVAGHCPAIVDEVYDRFSPEMVNGMTLEDVKFNYCAAMDARHLLSLDQSILEAQIALDLLHLQSKFHDLSQLKLSISKSQDASQRILGYCKKKGIKLDFIILEFIRPAAAPLNQSEQKKGKAREQEIRPHLDAVIDASRGVAMYSEDPSSLLEGRLRFKFRR